ncbi:MAG: UDP-3-O-(3-hydroxymyristoyl)glucosamine N-acyltransferase [Woeseiaceae bacterium]|nr:UDP-3-O-(3-hydroxymyristoyl)glucosamine N-acyltransferase [Woeseiaceae bacterium]
MAITLGELADQVDCELRGSRETVIETVATFSGAGPNAITFLSNAAYKPQLPDTRAAAVILKPADADDCPVAAIVHDDPYACYARMAALLHPALTHQPGVHPTAFVSEDAVVSKTAYVGPNAVIEGNAVIGDGCEIGPGSYVGPDCVIGAGTRLLANVTFVRAVTTGQRGLIHPGAVIGGDGFGNAMTPEGWVKVPQVGGVKIGDDVEIGCNSTVDCGAIGDTVIGNGVRLDNLVMIAHNCRIGDHTAMAAYTGIAGSTTIGSRCLFAGKSGAVGHITICDDVVVTGKTMVTKDIDTPGAYASSFAAEPAKDWAKNVARVRRLGKLFDRVGDLEKDKS